MKRDLDLVRKILLVCEAAPHGYAPHPLLIEGHSDEQVGFHVYLMIQAGLLEGGDRTYIGAESPQAIAQAITWAGYEFLEASRDEERWNRTTDAARAAGGLTLEVLSATLSGLAIAAVKKAVGLP